MVILLMVLLMYVVVDKCIALSNTYTYLASDHYNIYQCDDLLD